MSVTKGITSTLVGIAVDRGLLKLDQKVVGPFGDLAPSSQQDGKSAIELQQILKMSQGLSYDFLRGEPRGPARYLGVWLSLPRDVNQGWGGLQLDP